MSEIFNNEGASTELVKPVQSPDSVDASAFPPFPDPVDTDFDEDISEEERAIYKNKFSELTKVINHRLHCTACDRHLGCSASNESKMKIHPMLRTLVCQTCHSFYNSGEFDKGDDGSELYCRWCGQGGQVYCCSDCPHVFCAKCIKRNFGIIKIREIENTDDWKCFNCNPNCLYDLRAICWALLRFCDLKNKLSFDTTDPILKQKYDDLNTLDLTTCCKSKIRKKDKDLKKKEAENVAKKIISKMPPTIQVKKFASINMDAAAEPPKKAQKRPASPKTTPKPMAVTSITIPHQLKKIKLFSSGVTPVLSPVRFAPGVEKKYPLQYTRMTRPRMPTMPIMGNMYNGYSNAMFSKMTNNIPVNNDNINLSLESLTQGLDMAAVSAMNNSDVQDSNVVCTPDFPMEPLCEVTEDNDDDVQCITPASAVTPKISNPPPLLPRNQPNNDNIVQMTENDVTVNAVTGGLKFRVDPQTLSANKMYRLPDGRVFAINPNPNMPGGYSATIVSVSDSTGKVAPKGETFAAKLSTVTSTSTPKYQKRGRPVGRTGSRKSKRKQTLKPKESNERRECDMKVPVEWYRYNLIDAIDALEYSLSRLESLKKEATTAHLRTRTADEMKCLHKSLENNLATSTKRFYEIRENLNKELKNYLEKKTNKPAESSGEDDDVLILPNDNDDPISIDENSVDSVNDIEPQEVDLTEAASSEQNDSYEKNTTDPLQRPGDKNNASNVDNTWDNDSNAFKSILVTNVTGNSNKSDAVQKDDTNIENGLDESNDILDDTNDNETKTNGKCEDTKGDGENIIIKDDNDDTDTEEHDLVKMEDESSAKDEEEETITGDIIRKPDEVDKSIVKEKEETITGDIVRKPDEVDKSVVKEKEETITGDIIRKPDEVDKSVVKEEEETITGDIIREFIKTDKKTDDKIDRKDDEETTDGSDTEPLENKTEASNEPDVPINDTEMSEEMIENLLKDNIGDGMENVPSLMDIPDFEEAQ